MHGEWAWPSRDTAACNMALVKISLVMFGGIVTYLRIRGLLARSCTRYMCTHACVYVCVCGPAAELYYLDVEYLWQSETTGWRTSISILDHETKIKLDECPKKYMLMLRVKSHYL